MITTRLAALSNNDLLTEVKRLAARESEATADLVASLAELDARRLYLDQGCSSLFTYCTQVLHLSEHSAYHRIEAARAARKFPLILERLSRGVITLTAVGLLAPHLTMENHRDLLDAAHNKSKRDVELLVARLRPREDVPASVRKLPATNLSVSTSTIAVADERATGAAVLAGGQEPAPAGAVTTSDDSTAPGGGVASAGGRADAALLLVSAGSSPPKRPAVVAPLAPERYKVQMTVSAETHAKLRRAQDLLRHTIPDGDVAAVFDRALTVLITDLEKRKLAATRRPHVPSRASERGHTVEAARAPERWSERRKMPERRGGCCRHIPAAVKRAVWARDEGRCAFVGAAGRCTETGRLEFHHLIPYAAGGKASVDSIALRCQAHNGLEAERWFGTEVLEHARMKAGAEQTPASTRSGPS
jgi:5-methylcytosine-specific restriction endonuclease McrA